jgi:glycosyltransferase involved in cell wall biosynthesis
MGEEMSSLVSIVMGTYNGEKYLRPQIESILTQSYRNIELIVVDDASRDSTLSILRDYAARDSRIQLYPAEQNRGVVANFQRGIELAKGELIAFSDQDDIFRHDKIELLVKALTDNLHCDLVVSDLNLIDEKGALFAESMWSYQKLHPTSDHPFRRLVHDNFATGCAMMVRRRLLDLALPFPEHCVVHDWWLAVVAASEKAGGICLVHEPLVKYRQHASNVYGAYKPEPLTLKNGVLRVTAPPRGRMVYENRKKACIVEINRLKGYVTREIWSVNDRVIIDATRQLFQDYIADGESNLFQRLLRIPQRVRYALLSANARKVVTAVYYSVYPFK